MPLGMQSWGTKRSWRFWTNGRRREARWREKCERGISEGRASFVRGTIRLRDWHSELFS